MTAPLDIGRLLVSARRRQGVSQQELARRIDSSQPQIARWEASEYRSASLANVDAVATALGVVLGEPEPLPVAAETSAFYLPGASRSGSPALTRLGVSAEVVAAFCRSHGIREMALFGSALRRDFTSKSDVDVLVRWHEQRKPQSFSALEDAQTELAGIFRRRVDLVEHESVESSENHIRRSAILDHAQVVYAEG